MGRVLKCVLKDVIDSSQHPVEIYALQMPQGNTYVVNSLDLVNSAQRNWKTLSFAPFVATFLKRLCLPSKAATNIIDTNLYAEDGPWGLFTDTHNAMHQSLAPGPGLDVLICTVLQRVSDSLDRLLEQRDEVEIDPYISVRETITFASTMPYTVPIIPFELQKFAVDFGGSQHSRIIQFPPKE